MSPCQVVVPVDPWSPAAQGGPGVDHGQAGFYAPALGPYSNQVTVGNVGRAYYIRVVCPCSMTISKIGFAVTAAASVDDPVDVGIFNLDGSVLLGSSGAKNGVINSTGAKQVPLLVPVPVVKGVAYYASLSVGGTGASGWNITGAFVVQGGLGTLFGSTLGVVEVACHTPLFPLSAPLVGAVPVGGAPILALMQ